MERSVSVAKGTDNIMTCNSCFSRNYESAYTSNEGKIVSDIYEVRIGNVVLRLCKDCMKELGKAILTEI